MNSLHPSALPQFTDQRQMDTLKRLQAETAVKDTGQAAAELDALLPSILDRAFKGEL